MHSFLREYNLYSMQNLTMHEGVPGHYLQIALSNRYSAPLRSVFWSSPFVEGWAAYAERVMMNEGYLDHDPLMRLINLKWYLRAITNAIIDSAIHVDGMSREQAMKLMVEGGLQEHLEMCKAVEAAWGDAFTLRCNHDTVLSYGSPPARFVRALILNEPIPDN